jgi:hypothetical protein
LGPAHSAHVSLHFFLPAGKLDWAPKVEITGPAFGFSFLGFRFSRLLLCSRFAIALSFIGASA